MNWDTLSEAQHAVITYLATNPVVLIRSRLAIYYDGLGNQVLQERVAGLQTVRSLVRRGFLEWQGDASDPEEKAGLSDLGRATWVEFSNP